MTERKTFSMHLRLKPTVVLHRIPTSSKMIFNTANRRKTRPYKIVQPVSGKPSLKFIQPPAIKAPVINAINDNLLREMPGSLYVNNLFEISFHYLNRNFRTKVLQVTYGNGSSIYKVALAGAISPHARMCWMQYEKTGWAVILGTATNGQLISAITSAIANYHKPHYG
jgi:hypothetical protein